MPAYLGGRDEGQIREAREAVEVAERIGDPALQAYALFHLRGAQWLPDNPEDRLALSEEMLRLALEAGDLTREFEARAWRASDLLDLARIPDFSDELDEMKRVAEITREAAHEWYASAWRAGLSIAKGDFAVGEPAIVAALQLGQHATAEAVPQFGAQLNTLRVHQGRGTETAPLMKQAWEQSPNQVAYLAAVARDLVEMGQHDDARPYLDVLLTVDWGEVPRDFLWIGTFHLAGRSAALTNDRELASRVYDVMLSCQHLMVTYAAGCSEGPVALTLAVLAAVLGSHDAARGHFQDALSINEINGLRPTLALAQKDYARFLLNADAPGDRSLAIELLRAALATARELGMAKVEQDAEALLASIN
jgi:tetratricopeptide (TPR) repeat protein